MWMFPMTRKAVCRIPIGPAVCWATSPPTHWAALMAKGDLSKVTGWLREKIHRHASFIKPDQLFKQVCGTFDAKFYTDYLTKKYTELYNL